MNYSTDPSNPMMDASPSIPYSSNGMVVAGPGAGDVEIHETPSLMVQKGRDFDVQLDNNVGFPVTPEQMSTYVTLGGRIDPSIESMRIKGGVVAANNNRTITLDDRNLAPYMNMYWEETKKEDSYLFFPIVTSTQKPPPAERPVN
eukprot:jgi/Mesvir1/1532/Mv14515-RA.1